jgi:hypothetical protein
MGGISGSPKKPFVVVRESVVISVIFSGYRNTFDGPPRGHPWADPHQTWIGLRLEAQAAGLAATGACGRRLECS